MKGVEWTIQWRIMLTQSISQLLRTEVQKRELSDRSHSLFIGANSSNSRLAICRHSSYATFGGHVVTACTQFHMASYTDVCVCLWRLSATSKPNVDYLRMVVVLLQFTSKFFPSMCLIRVTATTLTRDTRGCRQTDEKRVLVVRDRKSVV